MNVAMRRDRQRLQVLDNDYNVMPTCDADGNPVITLIRPGLPACGAGLRVGDAILTVDGKGAQGRPLEWLFNAVIGPVGTAVTFTVKRADGQQTISVVRQCVPSSDVAVNLLPGGIGYLSLTGFDHPGVTAQVRAAL